MERFNGIADRSRLNEKEEAQLQRNFVARQNEGPFFSNPKLFGPMIPVNCTNEPLHKSLNRSLGLFGTINLEPSRVFESWISLASRKIPPGYSTGTGYRNRISSNRVQSSFTEAASNLQNNNCQKNIKGHTEEEQMLKYPVHHAQSFSLPVSQHVSHPNTLSDSSMSSLTSNCYQNGYAVTVDKDSLQYPVGDVTSVTCIQEPSCSDPMESLEKSFGYQPRLNGHHSKIGFSSSAGHCLVSSPILLSNTKSPSLSLIDNGHLSNGIPANCKLENGHLGHELERNHYANVSPYKSLYGLQLNEFIAKIQQDVGVQPLVPEILTPKKDLCIPRFPLQPIPETQNPVGQLMVPKEAKCFSERHLETIDTSSPTLYPNNGETRETARQRVENHLNRSGNPCSEDSPAADDNNPAFREMAAGRKEMANVDGWTTVNSSPIVNGSTPATHVKMRMNYNPKLPESSDSSSSDSGSSDDESTEDSSSSDEDEKQDINVAAHQSRIQNYGKEEQNKEKKWAMEHFIPKPCFLESLTSSVDQITALQTSTIRYDNDDDDDDDCFDPVRLCNDYQVPTLAEEENHSVVDYCDIINDNCVRIVSPTVRNHSVDGTCVFDELSSFMSCGRQLSPPRTYVTSSATVAAGNTSDCLTVATSAHDQSLPASLNTVKDLLGPIPGVTYSGCKPSIVVRIKRSNILKLLNRISKSEASSEKDSISNKPELKCDDGNQCVNRVNGSLKTSSIVDCSRLESVKLNSSIQSSDVPGISLCNDGNKMPSVKNELAVGHLEKDKSSCVKEKITLNKHNQSSRREKQNLTTVPVKEHTDQKRKSSHKEKSSSSKQNSSYDKEKKISNKSRTGSDSGKVYSEKGKQSSDKENCGSNKERSNSNSEKSLLKIEKSGLNYGKNKCSFDQIQSNADKEKLSVSVTEKRNSDKFNLNMDRLNGNKDMSCSDDGRTVSAKEKSDSKTEVQNSCRENSSSNSEKPHTERQKSSSGKGKRRSDAVQLSEVSKERPPNSVSDSQSVQSDCSCESLELKHSSSARPSKRKSGVDDCEPESKRLCNGVEKIDESGIKPQTDLTEAISKNDGLDSVDATRQPVNGHIQKSHTQKLLLPSQPTSNYALKRSGNETVECLDNPKRSKVTDDEIGRNNLCLENGGITVTNSNGVVSGANVNCVSSSNPLVEVSTHVQPVCNKTRNAIKPPCQVYPTDKPLDRRKEAPSKEMEKTMEPERLLSAEYYLQEARRLKREGSGMKSDSILKLLSYADSLLSFVCHCFAMELEHQDPARTYKVLQDTLKFCQHVCDARIVDCITDKHKHHILVVTYRLQSIICLKLYRRNEVSKLKAAMDDYNKNAVQPLQIPSPYQKNSNAMGATVNGNHVVISDAMSPMSPRPIPSPAGSVGSVRSSGSGDFSVAKPGMNGLGGGGGGTSSSSDVLIPSRIHSILTTYLNHMNYLLQCHTCWDLATDILNSDPDVSEFFADVDSECGPIDLHSSMLSINRYVSYVIRRIQMASDKVR